MGNSSQKFNLHKSTSCEIVNVSSTITFGPDFYWRDYSGEVPSDAIIAGKDEKGENVYVGQAYRENAGIIPVQISAGSDKVYTYIFRQVVETTKGIKILCGTQENFQWIAADGPAHSTATEDGTIILGGFDMDYNYHIGRVKHEGAHKIGKIPFERPPEDRICYFYHDGKELDNSTYEVLVFKRE